MNDDDSVIHVLFPDSFPDEFASPDVYFTPGYGQAAALASDGQWILLESFHGEWQVPLIVRTLADGTKDAISPYGYAGVFASPSLSSVQVQQAWSATISSLRELGVISVLLRHSPLVPQPPDLPELISIVRGHPTILLELTDTDSAWSDLAKNCRNKIRKALKNGYTGDVRNARRQDLEPGSDFRRLYDQKMQRLGAAPQYFFSDSYFTKLFDGLESDLFIAEVRSPKGTVASSALLMRHEQLLHNHLSCSNLEDASMGANNLSTWQTIEFAIDQGLNQRHLGGGRYERDSLFKFKSSFGGRELEYRASGLIIDEEAYQAQVNCRAKECGTTAETLLTSSFFPAYRGGKSE